MKTNGNQRTQMNGTVADRREISEWSVGERSEPMRKIYVRETIERGLSDGVFPKTMGSDGSKNDLLYLAIGGRVKISF